jgi:hypothetical protein
VSVSRYFEVSKKWFQLLHYCMKQWLFRVILFLERWLMNWHMDIIHKAVPFKIIIFYWLQTALNSRKRRDGSWCWTLRPHFAPRGKLSVCLCVFVLVPPDLGRSQPSCWLLAPPRAALCDVASDSQCLNVLRGASVQRGPLKATHFSPAIRDPQAVKLCTLSWT